MNCPYCGGSRPDDVRECPNCGEERPPSPPKTKPKPECETTLVDKIRPLQARVAQLGPADPDFDMKAATDEL
jgi:hypothetical protein